MSVTSRSGFNVIELAVVVLVVAVFVSVLATACGINAHFSGITILAIRGKDIFLSIIGANTEREPLGLPPLWPSDDGPLTNAIWGVECFNFSNSTDYFRYLYDEEHAGTDAWSPFVAGFDYSMLAGAGVPPCVGKPLTAAHNMWTVAKNVRDKWDDAVPVLVTRNIDAGSLAAKVTRDEWSRRVHFSDEWETPFKDDEFVIVRKSGAVFKSGERRAGYDNVYQKVNFDTSLAQEGCIASPPLKYLTPTREVTPGDAAYAESLARQAGMKRTVRRMNRELRIACKGMLFAAIPCVVVYLLAAFVYGRGRWSRGQKPSLPEWVKIIGGISCCSAILYSISVVCLGIMGRMSWVLLFLAVAMQGTGLMVIRVLCRDDREARRWAMAWMLATPVITVVIWICVGIAMAISAVVISYW